MAIFSRKGILWRGVEISIRKSFTTHLYLPGPGSLRGQSPSVPGKCRCHFCSLGRVDFSVIVTLKQEALVQVQAPALQTSARKSIELFLIGSVPTKGRLGTYDKKNSVAAEPTGPGLRATRITSGWWGGDQIG